MSMSVCVVGVRDLDKKFKRMIELKKACETAGVSYHPEVLGFFKNPIKEYGSLADCSEKLLREAMTEMEIPYDGDVMQEQDGMRIKLADLPPDVKEIRVFTC